MAFSISIGDVIAATTLARKTVQGARKACGEYDDLTRDVTNVYAVLRRLKTELETSNSLLNQTNQELQGELGMLISDCQKVLRVLDTILQKYNALSETERSGRKLWQRIRFGNGEVEDVQQQRARLCYYTATLSLHLNMTSLGSQGRVEKQMKESGADIEEIQKGVNRIAAHLMSRKVHEGSVMTNYDDDEKAFWKELRRALVKDGFTSSKIRHHKDLIQAYVRELANRGVLDDHTKGDFAAPSQSPTPIHTEQEAFKDSYDSTPKADESTAKSTIPSYRETSDRHSSEKDPREEASSTLQSEGSTLVTASGTSEEYRSIEPTQEEASSTPDEHHQDLTDANSSETSDRVRSGEATQEVVSATSTEHHQELTYATSSKTSGQHLLGEATEEEAYSKTTSNEHFLGPIRAIYSDTSDQAHSGETAAGNVSSTSKKQLPRPTQAASSNGYIEENGELTSLTEAVRAEISRSEIYDLSADDLVTEIAIPVSLEDLYYGGFNSAFVVYERDGLIIHQRLNLTIEPGCLDHCEKTVYEVGNIMKDGKRQEVHLFITRIPDTIFERYFSDLYAHFELGPKEKAGSWMRIVPIFDCGPEIIVDERDEPYCISGNSLEGVFLNYRFEGRGMPVMTNPGQRGDLYVKILS